MSPRCRNVIYGDAESEEDSTTKTVFFTKLQRFSLFIPAIYLPEKLISSIEMLNVARERRVVLLLIQYNANSLHVSISFDHDL